MNQEKSPIDKAPKATGHESVLEQSGFSNTGISMSPPPLQMLSEKEKSANQQEDEDPLKVSEGQLSFDSEGNDNPNSTYFTRTIHYPPVGDSGVTIGRGYDFGNRSQEDVRNHLTLAGFAADKISILEKAAGKKKEKAAKFVKENKKKVGVITHKQQKKLFEIVYGELKDDVVRIGGKEGVVERYGETDFENLHPAIMEVVVDLRYRGDYTPNTRKWIQPTIVKNNLQDMAKIMADEHWKTKYGVPRDRFNRRKKFMADAVAGVPGVKLKEESKDKGKGKPKEIGQGQEAGTSAESAGAETAQAQEHSGDTWDSHTNTRIAGIHPTVKPFALRFINRVQAELGITLRVTSGLRTFAEQDKLYAKGRTTLGGKVTNAKGGESYHNYGLAIDVVEITSEGKVNWSPDWDRIGAIGQSIGFEWGGAWTSFVDKPHFQMTFGHSIGQLYRKYQAKGGNFVDLGKGKQMVDKGPEEGKEKAKDGVEEQGQGKETKQTEDTNVSTLFSASVSTSVLRVRSGAGTEGYEVVDRLSNGERVEVYQQEGVWLRIGKGRWVHGDYVTRIQETGAASQGAAQ